MHPFIETQKEWLRDNLQAAIDAQGPDAMDTKTYWDTKTAPTCQ